VNVAAERTFESFEVGETHRTSGRTTTESDIRMFTGATGSTDPIHIDREYAARHPLVDGVVAQGTLTLSVADGLVVEAIAADAALSMNVGHDSVRYLAPVSPGDTLAATVEVIETERRDDDWGLVVARVDVTNQEGTPVLTEEHRLLIATSDNPALEA
jgi:acyl dehydratase